MAIRIEISQMNECGREMRVEFKSVLNGVFGIFNKTQTFKCDGHADIRFG